MGRKFPFRPKYALLYGLRITERSPDNQGVISCVCRFCETFGREEETFVLNGVKRRRTQNVHSITTFRCDTMKRHCETQHLKQWNIYQELPTEKKRTFFDDDPSVTHHPHHQSLVDNSVSPNMPPPPEQQEGGILSVPIAPAAVKSPTTVSVQSPSTLPCTTLSNIRLRARHFSQQRDWFKYHTPRNVMLALTAECGELAECFQWRSDKECCDHLQGWEEKDKVHVGEELADVLIYLVRLADVCGIDLARATERKFELNKKKYPVEVVRGSRKKYTEFHEKMQDEKKAQDEAEKETE